MVCDDLKYLYRQENEIISLTFLKDDFNDFRCVLTEDSVPIKSTFSNELPFRNIVFHWIMNLMMVVIHSRMNFVRVIKSQLLCKIQNELYVSFRKM